MLGAHVLSAHLSSLVAHLQESLVRQRGEVARERTDAVHLMTQAELDVKEMQDSMQNSKHTQVSGVHSAKPCPVLPSGAGLALVVVAVGCVPRCLPMVCCSRAAGPCSILTSQNANRLPSRVAQAKRWHTCVVQFCRRCALR